MLDINEYKEEKTCIFKDDEYLVRDNGAVLRKPLANKRLRKFDNVWTFGTLNEKTGYLQISSVRVHRIVAIAFHGEAPTKDHIVFHIDANKQNNCPSNLRWVTRLESVVLNPITRKRIEYRLGINIFAFLNNPFAYKAVLDVPEFRWLSQVTEEETKSCLIQLKKWSEEDGISRKDVSRKKTAPKNQVCFSSRNPVQQSQNITDSLTIMAKQKDWATPTEFVCCPEKVEGDPIKCYLKNLSEGAKFATNQYGDSTVVKYALVGDNAIVVVTDIPSFIKPLALVKITYEEEYYLHTSLGTFFTEEGAEKQFTVEQGLEWTGEDSIDDCC